MLVRLYVIFNIRSHPFPEAGAGLSFVDPNLLQILSTSDQNDECNPGAPDLRLFWSNVGSIWSKFGSKTAGHLPILCHFRANSIGVVQDQCLVLKCLIMGHKL